MNALHWASKNSLYKIVEILIKHNSDIDAKDIV